MLKRVLQTFVAGVFVLAPFALTIYVVWAGGAMLGQAGNSLLRWVLGRGPGAAPVVAVGDTDLSGLLGGAIVLVLIYLAGLTTRWWVFGILLRAAERLFGRLPGIKTIYESVRDLMKLFGGGASNEMGRSVLYKPAGSGMALLGILTNEHPRGTAEAGDDRVAVYLPMAFSFSGALVYVPRNDVQEVDIPVEQALKLCATGEVSRARS
jgi:uncharacterized membrane protein